MLLRNRPLMCYRGIRNWPPAWVCIEGQDEYPKGEIGILRTVLLSKVEPTNRITELLRFCGNRSIAEIGSIDISYLL
jgi:hypothetical protein